jgi:hypothetical protein
MKETWDERMKVTASQNPCARTDDLVAYLYGEATKAGAREFENHMQQCASCRTELATFGEVREAIGEWRQQSLGALASPALEANAARGSVTPLAYQPRRSALAALREFFALSPAWMRAATAAIVLAFCALSVIAIAYFVREPQTVIVEKEIRTGYSDEEVEKMIAEAVKKQSDVQMKEATAPAASPVLTAGSDQRQEHPRVKRNSSDSPQIANNNRQRQPVAPRNRVRPSTEQASSDYLPFTASVDDEKLPSLADLVNDDN